MVRGRDTSGGPRVEIPEEQEWTEGEMRLMCAACRHLEWLARWLAHLEEEDQGQMLEGVVELRGRPTSGT